MRRSLAAWCFLIGGCGLFPDLGSLTDHDDASSSDASVDGSPADVVDADVSSTTNIQRVQSNQDSTPSTATSLSVGINASGAGNLIVVGLTQESGTTAVVTTISDDAAGGSNVYVSANERSADSSCANTAEIWYAKATKPGAKTVIVSMSASVAFEVWVAEFSGVSTSSPFVTGGATSSASTATILAPQAVVSSAPALVVSVATTCGAISAVHAGSPFTALPILDGEDTAYAIVTKSGSYGAEWSYSSGTWNASTAAFR